MYQVKLKIIFIIFHKAKLPCYLSFTSLEIFSLKLVFSSISSGAPRSQWLEFWQMETFFLNFELKLLNEFTFYLWMLNVLWRECDKSLNYNNFGFHLPPFSLIVLTIKFMIEDWPYILSKLLCSLILFYSFPH